MSTNSVNLADLSDLCTPWCIHTVATLRIADIISDGTKNIQDIAKISNTNEYALHNVLGHLVTKGVFEEPEPGLFELNEISEGLLDPAQRPDLTGIGGRMAYAWGTIPTYVQTGTSGYEKHFSLPFWDDLEAHPEIRESFDAIMGKAGHGTPNPDFAISGGWESIRTVVDVGGGTGSMLAEILKKNSEIEGTLVDLPQTVANSHEIFNEAGVVERVKTVAQSFFDQLPAGADLYLLRKVLGNWSLDDQKIILQRCAEAVKLDGKIVIIGGIVPDGTPHKLNIEMVLLGGKVNTLSEFRKLAKEVGLVVVQDSILEHNLVVECRLDK